MAREAVLLLFNSVHVTVSTICRISFVCAQARIAKVRVVFDWDRSVDHIRASGQQRLHSKAEYMAAPERFAQTSNSFPLHRGRRPYMGAAGQGGTYRVPALARGYPMGK
jgi:hypothetical protein